MNEDTPVARRLTRAAQRALNELIAGGVPIASAMQRICEDPGAFEPVTPTQPATPTAAPRPAWSGDRTDWQHAVRKLETLRALDRGCTTFGATTHRYVLRPRLATHALAAIEAELGVQLPPGLRTFYLTVGDGGAGPDYGLFAAAKLAGQRPEIVYPGIDALRALGARSAAQPPEPTIAALSPSRLTGVVTILFSGCTMYSGVVCTGDIGRVVHWDEDHIAETDDTLVGWYERWLDEQISQFELVARMQAEGATLDAMVSAMKQLLPADLARAARTPRARQLVETTLRGLAADAG